MTHISRLIVAGCFALGICAAPTKAVAVSASGQEDAQSEPSLIPYLDANGRFGYVDAANQLRISSQFDEAKPFANGIAAVKQGNLWGYIDAHGTWLVKPRFTRVTGVADGYAMAVIDVEWKGLGKKPAPRSPNFTFGVPDIHLSLTLQKEATHQYCIAPSGVVQDDDEPDCKQAYLRRYLRHTYSEAYATQDAFDHGFRPLTQEQMTVKFVRRDEPWTISWAVADGSGQPIGALLFSDIPDFRSMTIPPQNKENARDLMLNDAHLALVGCYTSSHFQGVVNAAGTMVVPCRYDTVRPVTRDGTLFGFIGVRTDLTDARGQSYDETTLFKTDGAASKPIRGQASLGVSPTLSSRYVIVWMSGADQYKVKVYDLVRGVLFDDAGLGLPNAGIRTVSPIEDNAWSKPIVIDTDHDGLCLYTANLENKGCGYQNISGTSHDLISVCNAQGCGALDFNGNIVVPLLYDNTVSFDSAGLAFVKRASALFYIDVHGREYRAAHS